MGRLSYQSKDISSQSPPITCQINKQPTYHQLLLEKQFPDRFCRKGGFLGYLRQSANFYIISRHLIYLRESSGMVEVIHRFHGHYPFGLKKQAENTYMEILKENQSEEEIAVYRQKNKIYREINNSHFIKLHKMLREGNNLYFLYEYYERSLENYISGLQTDLNEVQNRERFRNISQYFRRNVDNIIDALVKAEIKADLFLSNLAYVQDIDKNETFFLKTFIDCDAEYLSIMTHGYRAKEQKRKDKSGINQEFLQEFYEAERKKLMVQFEEVYEKKFGKIVEVVEKKQTPNFVINGTKLVFINNEERTSLTQQQNFAKSNKVTNNRVEPQEKAHQLFKNNNQVETKSSVNLLPIHHNKPKTPLPVQNYNKPKTPLPVDSYNKPKAPVPVVDKKKLQQEEEQKKIERKIERIVNFDQSFEPDFKPEEFTKQNTYIFEENDYLDSLEEEINKLANEKKMHDSKKSTGSEPQKPKQQEKIHKNSTESPAKKQPTDIKNKNSQRKDSQPNPTTPNQNNLSNNHSNNHSNSNISNQSQAKIEQKEIDIRTEKVNKYKMKIITSHQIEIEGGDQPNVEEIEREILEGLRTGKLNINELTAQKGVTATSKNQLKNQINTSSQNNSKDLASSSHANKSQNSDNSSKDTKQITSNLQKPKRPTIQTEKDHSGSSDSHQTKMRNINEIIDKINQKYQSNPVQQPVDQPKQHKVEHKQTGPNIPTVSSTPQHKMQKVELNEPASDKGEKAENYINKIREAKSKAEQILREYTKKKQ